MTDFDTHVADLKKRIDAATRARARAEHELDAAMAAAAAARKQLADEFGVGTAEGAKAKLATLENDLEQALADLNQLLGEIGV